MKYSKITIGGRRSLPNYEHLTAEVEVAVEEGESVEAVLSQASDALEVSFQAAADAVRGGTGVRPAPIASVTVGSNRKEAARSPAEKMVGARPAGAPAPAPAAPPPPTPPAAPVTTPPGQSNGVPPERVAALRGVLAERELSEGEFVIAAGVKSLVDLPGMKTPCTKKQISAMVDTIARIMQASDNVTV